MNKIQLLIYGLLLLITASPVFLQGQSASNDTTRMIIDKKFTITFEDEIRLKHVKKTPEYKRVEVAPERNPIIYNKQAFYHSLNIKKQKSLEELFEYPLFTAYLSGGNLSSVSGGLGFQANAKKFVPSLNWNFIQGETGAADSDHQKMDFNGGLRLKVNEQLHMNVNLLHSLHKSGDYDYLPGSIDDDFRSSLMQIGLNVGYQTEQFFLNVGSLTEDYIHEYRNKTHFFQSGLDYQTMIQFNAFSVYSNGTIQWAQTELEDTETEYSYYLNESGLKYTHEKFKLSGGVIVLNHDQLIGGKNKTNFSPALDAEIVVLPAKIKVFSGFSRFFRKTGLKNIQNRFLHTVPGGFLPGLVNWHITAGASWQMATNLSLRGWYSVIDYEAISIWKKSSVDSLYSRQQILPGDDPVRESSVNIAVEWKNNWINLLGGSAFSFWDFEKSNVPYLQAENTLYVHSIADYQKFRMTAEMNYESGRSFYPGESEKETLLLLNLYAQYPVYPKFYVTVDLDNILNQSYSRIPGFQEAGFRALAGIKYKW